MTTKLFAIALAVLVCPIPSFGELLRFETDTFRLTLAGDGTVEGLLDKSLGEEWVQPSAEGGRMPIAVARVGERTVPATEIVRRGEGLTVRFGASGVEADYRLTPRGAYLLIELVDVRGAGVEEIVFAQFPVKSTQRGSGLLNAKWNEQFTVCLMGLDEEVEAGFGPGASLRCTAHRAFGLGGRRAALIAVPTPRFYEVVQGIEREFQIPYATLGGQWAKTSPDVRRGYLFIDLTEHNAAEVIRLAKLGGFGAILVYSGTWATSNGSYPINTANFPRGEASLKAVADKCHAAGLKLGIHMLTSFVAKHDPLVRPKPDPRLLSDAEAVLGADLDAGATEIVAAARLEGFPGEAAYYGERGGMDVRIDDEIIRYEAVGGAGSTRLLRCTRGAHGTVAAPHKAGAKIRHLAERYSSYLVDLRTSLKDELAERIAGVINRCGLDMIYFDGGEVNDANGPAWYWVGVQQSAVFARVKRDLLVQGSGMTQRTWHFYSRGTCDDFDALAPKEYLDYHKIADSWQGYHSSFLPAELGWWGFLSARPDHPATTPDEVELYATRMHALDSAVSLETTLADLKKCGRAEEMLALLGELERLRLSGRVPSDVRERLKRGEWHWTRGAGGDDEWQVQPVRYDRRHVNLPATVEVTNAYGPQPLRFRMQVGSALAPVGDESNIRLLPGDRAVEVALPAADAPMPGALAHRVTLARAVGDQPSALLVGPATRAAGKTAGGAVDLTRHRALAVRLEVEAPARDDSGLPAVLNVQVESEGKRYRDHYIDLDFTGGRTITLPGPTPHRMLREFRPHAANYPYKLATYTFDYGRIVALNLRWMRLPKDFPVRCRVSLVEALAESEAVLRDAKLTLDGRELPIPAELRTGDYAESWGAESIRIFDANGNPKQVLQAPDEVPLLNGPKGQLRIDAGGAVPVTLTTITTGPPLRAAPAPAP